MDPVPLHPGNLMTLAVDPAAMERIKPALTQAISEVLGTAQPDLSRMGLVLALARGGDDPQIAVDFVDLAKDATSIKPLLTTLHVIAGGIYALVRDKAPDDEAAFDAALARTGQILQQHKLDPRLAPIYTEAAVAAINNPPFAQMMVTTLYPDGRLLMLRGDLLNRLLQMHQQYMARQQPQA